ncbi:four helix bundle protein [Candidatus Woesearchaeota archaeon]|nr:four helix bundle protein [Candidatus Woesearchaeota archaeon]
MQPYKKLNIWKESYQIVLDIYNITEGFPKNEENNIIAQMRRAAMSMPVNIAEGASSMFDRNFFSHLSIAYASGKELETFVMLSKDLEYINDKSFRAIYEKIDRLNSQTYNFLKKLELRLDARKKARLNMDMPSDIGLNRFTKYTKSR